MDSLVDSGPVKGFGLYYGGCATRPCFFPSKGRGKREGGILEAPHRARLCDNHTGDLGKSQYISELWVYVDATDGDSRQFGEYGLVTLNVANKHISLISRVLA